jgi:5'-phosphate synthase pdxT subunit
MRCGVLALQGDWAAHAAVIDGLGAEPVAVRTRDELDAVEALVLPGGESTAMLRLMEADGLARALTERIGGGLPVLGTCAGIILLARSTEPPQPTLGLLDLDVARNAYGRQVHSRVAAVDLDDSIAGRATFDGVFIRAPKITRAGPGVTVLGRCGDDPALVRQGTIIAATFHPELTGDDRIHRMLIEGKAGHGR